jgi:hypothetical protein
MAIFRMMAVKVYSSVLEQLYSTSSISIRTPLTAKGATSPGKSYTHASVSQTFCVFKITSNVPPCSTSMHRLSPGGCFCHITAAAVVCMALFKPSEATVQSGFPNCNLFYRNSAIPELNCIVQFFAACNVGTLSRGWRRRKHENGGTERSAWNERNSGGGGGEGMSALSALSLCSVVVVV